MAKKDSDKLQRIDEAVELLQKGSREEKETASKELLVIFHPLIISAAQKIAAKFPHNIQEIIPLVQNKLIMMILEYRTPRRDTRGVGLLRGGWAPNINVYLKTNLYYFTMNEVMQDIDAPKRDYTGEGATRQLSDTEVIGVESRPDGIHEILDIIEEYYGAKVRDVVMLKYFGFRQGSIVWVTGMSHIQIRNALIKVRDKLKALEVL